ncbi:AAA family ATPase, partial [Mycobacterium sp. VKM Ac-1816D]
SFQLARPEQANSDVTYSCSRPVSDPVSVMYIDMENPHPELADRVRSMGRDPESIADLPLTYFSFPDIPPLDTESGGRKLLRAVEAHKPTLVVLDTISRLVEGKEDSADTWQNLYRHTMVPLRRQGCAVLRLDHQGHDASRAARGSSGKRDDVDVAWIMRREGNTLTLTRDKGRSIGYPTKHVLRRHLNPTRHVPQTSNDKVVELAQAMEDLGISPGTPRDVGAKLLRDNGFTLSNTMYAQAMAMRL